MSNGTPSFSKHRWYGKCENDNGPENERSTWGPYFSNQVGSLGFTSCAKPGPWINGVWFPARWSLWFSWVASWWAFATAQDKLRRKASGMRPIIVCSRERGPVTRAIRKISPGATGGIFRNARVTAFDKVSVVKMSGTNKPPCSGLLMVFWFSNIFLLKY